MLVLRSLAFNVAFYANLVFWMIVALPTLVLPRAVLMSFVQGWSRSSLWWLKVLVGTDVELRGAQNVPPEGCLIISKHQSVWETFALFALFRDPCIILKRELSWLPLFGWYVLKAGMIPIDRQGGRAAMNAMNAKARQRIAEGRQILIFAEGTRRTPGAPPAYKHGFAHLYAATGAPILPVALNSGVFWPRRRFLRWPGCIVIEVLPVIPGGLPRDEAFARTRDTIEAASDRLLAEAGWPRPGGTEQAVKTA